jgi:hypothetical protein
MQFKKLLVILAAMLVLAVTIILLIVNLAAPKVTDDFAVVYSKGGQLLLQSQYDTVPLKAKESKNQIFLPESSLLFYDAVLEDGLALFVCDLSNSKSRAKGGEQIAADVLENWTAAKDGMAVYVAPKGNKLMSYHPKNKKSTAISDGIETLFAAPMHEVFFFTKREGENRMLFRAQHGATPQRLATGVENPHFYADTDESVLLFLSKTTDGGQTTLCALPSVGGVTTITNEIGDVFYDDYKVGGNLYFLQNGQEITGVQVLVEDPQETADALLKEPKRSNYLNNWLGSILGDRSYERDVEAYKEKLERDTLRAEVKRVLQELPNNVSQKDLYAFDGTTAKRIAVGVTKDSIIALRAEGAASVLYQKQRVAASGNTKTITLDTLMLLYHSGGAEGVAKHLSELASESIIAAGYFIAQDTPSGVQEIQFAQEGRGEDWTVVFAQSPNQLLYLEPDVADGKHTLYAYDLLEYGVSERKMIDSGVTQLSQAKQGAYYRKVEAGGTVGSLYFFDGSQSQKIAHDVHAFFFAGDGGQIVAINAVKDQHGGVYVSQGGASWMASESAKIDSIRSNGEAVAFLGDWKNGSGSLYIIEEGKNAKLLDEQVTSLYALK